MVTTDKVTEKPCALDDFYNNLDTELTKNLHIVPWTRDISEWETAKGKCPKAKSWPSCCATILAHSVTSSTITLISNWRKYEGKQLIPATKGLHILITSVFTYEIIEVVSVKKWD